MRRIKPQTAWKAAWLAPWLTLLSGIPAIVLFHRASRLWQNQQREAYETCQQLFRVFSAMTGVIGLVAVVAELAVMLMGLVRLVKLYRHPQSERPSAGSYWGMLLCGPLFIAGTLLLMLLVHTFTYGMGV